ncbi:uncharacterized protein EDB91DRAFT_426117 [Suillus paluster]|uniref:uncharacterized protein n=1 Tax=Suillus paluster TaxID=48578 RepID=UPI001B86C59A|nr:uncharacterized protein EDB91DRAFT_426117 [Suillus paluster]KAG1753930.1 hypothetical protein EDB91DRAFT_426117 [Suillus paluster]
MQLTSSRTPISTSNADGEVRTELGPRTVLIRASFVVHNLLPAQKMHPSDVPMNIDGNQTGVCAQPSGSEGLMQAQPAGPDCDGGEQPTDSRPPRKRKTRRSPEAIAAQFGRRLAKQIEKAVAEAKKNTEVFDTFHFEKAVLERARSRHQVPAHWNELTERKREWHDIPRLATSAEGIPIVLHLPSIIRDRGHAELYSAVMTFGSLVPLAMGAGADQKTRNTKESYKVVEGQLAGNIQLVTAWHAVGHSRAL